jgi:hypothetical protein
LATIGAAEHDLPTSINEPDSPESGETEESKLENAKAQEVLRAKNSFIGLLFMLGAAFL